ncbi:MAG: 5'-deoxynucleotidase [Clostridia bacterium]
MYTFYAFMNRMKLIERWNLMRSNIKEDLMQHSASVAILGQALGIIRNEMFGGSVNVEKIASLALYHDTAEVVSGDLPTPVKYYNATMKTAYTEIEDMINARLLGSMPEELQGKYSEYLIPDESTVEYKLMKIADKLSAYIKCIEERLLGNREFDAAYARLSKVLDKTRKEYPELGYFLDNFIDGFGECLDIL